MRKLRQLIERLLPWFDPEREAAKDERVDELVGRANELVGLRRSFRQMDDRMARRR